MNKEPLKKEIWQIETYEVRDGQIYALVFDENAPLDDESFERPVSIEVFMNYVNDIYENEYSFEAFEDYYPRPFIWSLLQDFLNQ